MENYRVVLSKPGAYVPPTIMTNADLEKIVDTSDEWIVSMTGMRERRIALGESARDMAVKAINNAFIQNPNIDSKAIDAIKLSLNRHDDDITFPQHSGYVANAIGRPSKIDFSDGPFRGCVGLIGVIDEAWNALMNPKKNLNLIAAGATENLTGFTNYADRNTCVLFGDGAVFYFLMKVRADSNEEGIINTYLGGTFDINGYLTMQKSKGLRIVSPKNPQDKFGFEEIDQNWLTMVGDKVMGFASRAFKRAAHRVLEGTPYQEKDGEKGIKEVDVIIPHSANKRIIDPAINSLMDKGFRGKVVTCYEYFGNTSSTSIGIADKEGRKSGDIKPGNLVMGIAFGGGLQEGAILYRAV